MTFSKLAVPLLLAAGLAAGAGAQEPEAATPVGSSAMAPDAREALAAPAPDGTAVAAPAPDQAAGAPEPAAPEAGESEAAGVEAGPATGAPAPKAEHAVELGPVGHDAQGRAGHVHVVQRGDTLWDISDAYLGTPWVWPSLWRDNDAIENPHLIHPGDRIWISPFEMRKVSEAEAAALLAGQPAEAMSAPAALAETDAVPTTQATFHYTGMETTGFVTLDQLEGASSILESPEPRKWLSQYSEVLIGLGAGQVHVGDQFDIFRTEARVTDIDTGTPYGWATKELGWLEVTQVNEESATATIRESVAEIQRGDHVLPRRIRPTEIPLTGSPGPVEGRLVHLPDQRIDLGQQDVVYLDRGSRQGLAVGNALEVYRPLGDDGTAWDSAQKVERRIPDHVVAKLLVLDVFEDTSVALVTTTTEELARGDHFRGAESPNP